MTTADRAGINDTVGEFNGTARLLPRGDESPRYFMMSLQDIFAIPVL